MPEGSTHYNMINGDFLLTFLDSKASSRQLVEGLTLNCKDMEESFRFWQKVGLTRTGEHLHSPAHPYFKLYLNQIEAVSRGESFGRIAFACADEDVERVFKDSGATVQKSPVTLKTEGKADVVVTILETPDGQEICFVNESGFKDLSKETAEQIDWKKYDEQSQVQQKYLKK